MNRKDVYEQSIRHFLSPVLPLLEDQTVSEIMINGPAQIYYERSGKLHLSELVYPDAGHLMAAARNIGEFVGKTVGNGKHSMDARLPDGSRVHVIVPPCSQKGVCITIRKFQKSTFNLDKLIERGSISEEAVEFLRIAVLLHRNIVISGGTGTGKTSMLNALSTAIPEYERIIVIEDTSELQLAQPHTLYFEAQPPNAHGEGMVTIRDLFVDSLRMRPDRIVVGEVRRGEALDLIQSMISGHAGSLTTVHANSPRDAAVRLETLSLMSDVSLPAHVARTQVASAIHLVLQLARMGDGSRRVICISECHGLSLSDGQYVFEDLYRFNGEGRDSEGKILGKLEPTGAVASFTNELDSLGFRSEVKLTEKVFARKEEVS